MLACDRMNKKQNRYSVVVVGAGIAGLYMLHRLVQNGISAVVLERGKGVGGTWYWNRYPGARCDVESLEYSYSFSKELEQDWRWSERYAGQPEILRYINHVADRFELRRHIRFGLEVRIAKFDETRSSWKVATNSERAFECQFLIMATGCLSSTNMPHIEGVENFGGEIYHTGNWPHESVDFSGKRVAVIGTGSSAIQAIPHIAEECETLTVFQRTPNFSIPARNGPMDREHESTIKSNYSQFRANNRQMSAALGSMHMVPSGSALTASSSEHNSEFQRRWEVGGFGFLGAFNDLLLSHEANDVAAKFVRAKIRQTVTDPRIADTLCPDSVIGCKRLCLDTNYYETYNLPHVRLVDLKRDPIVRLDEFGIVCRHSTHQFNSIVFATGFDAMTGTLLRMDICGRDSKALRECWSDGPQTFLGLSTHGFPNLFLISGPGSPSVLTNMIVSIEQHVEWIERLLLYMREQHFSLVEASKHTQAQWVERVNAIASATLYPSCNSWYLGANIPGKPRVFMPYIGFPSYVQACEEVETKGYEGFEFQ